ncbi:MAG: hypothetical protein ABUL44_01620 [Flavobacterium sp.]
MKTKPKLYNLIEGKRVFKISLLVAALTIMGVYFWGLGQHNTFFENSIISTTILSIAFFLFISIGLYRGVRLKDDVNRRTIGMLSVDDVLDLDTHTSHHGDDFDMDVGDGIEGIIIGVLLWIFWAIAVALTLWIFSNIILVVIGTFAAMLYWIFFRAMRLVFNNSNKSKGNIWASIKYGLAYTLLYNCWIYGVFVLTEYFKK